MWSRCCWPWWRWPWASIGREQWPSYGPIFAAVGVLVLDGALRLGQSQKV